MRVVNFLFLKTLFLLISSSLLAKNFSNFDFQGDVSYVSNNISRAISQSGDRPAVQSNLKFTQEQGAHFSIFASTIDFKSNPSTKERVELNYDLGYKKEFEDFDFDLGLIYYHFPGVVNNVNFDFQEIYFDFSKQFKDFEVGNSFFISDNNYNDSGKSLYYNLYLNYYFSDKTTINVAYGYQEIEKDVAYGSSDYSDWLLGVDYKLQKNILLQLFYTGNDIEDDFCNEVCGETLTSSISYVF